MSKLDSHFASVLKNAPRGLTTTFNVLEALDYLVETLDVVNADMQAISDGFGATWRESAKVIDERKTILDGILQGTSDAEVTIGPLLATSAITSTSFERPPRNSCDEPLHWQSVRICNCMSWRIGSLQELRGGL